MKLFLLTTMLAFSLNSCGKNIETEPSKMNSVVAQTQNDEAQILALTRQFTQLMIARDTASLNKIVDTHFTLTHITGYVQPKSEWFAEIQQESMKYYSAEEVSRSLDVQGNRATFVQRNLLDARIWGSRNKWRLQQTMTLEKRGEKWVILQSVAKTF